MRILNYPSARKDKKNCETQKRKKVAKKACPYCKASFLQKYSQDRYVKNFLQEDDQDYVGNGRRSNGSTRGENNGKNISRNCHLPNVNLNKWGDINYFIYK